MEPDRTDAIELRVSQLQLSPAPHDACIDSEAESEAEEEEVEEEEQHVLLGFVQKPDKPWSLSRQLFPSKAGGVPAWLDPVNLPQGRDICCGICENPLQFLLQVYAPLEGNDAAFHRALFLFMCPNMACLHQDQHQQNKSLMDNPVRSVKVFRCQLPRTNKFYSTFSPKRDGTDTPSCTGVTLCSWCGTWRGEKICSGCRQTHYCCRAHQVDHWRAGHATFCRRVQAMNNHRPANDMKGEDLKFDIDVAVQHVDTGIVNPSCEKLWPEFEIVDDEEEIFTEQDSSRSESAFLDIKREKDESLKEFQELEEPSKEQQHWASFQARLSRAPDQILRYCRSVKAKPLWPKLYEQADNSMIPACVGCGGPRIFEFQVLSQLLYFFGVSNEPDSLDWATIAIFSCESSCLFSKSYVEEFAWVQLS